MSHRKLPRFWKWVIGLCLLANVGALFSTWPPRYSLISPKNARAVFHSRLNGNSYTNGTAPPMPPTNVFRLVHYPSAVGSLAAYLTPDPGDGRKRPVVIWGHGGFRGIGDDSWEVDNDQSPRAFLRKEFVLFCPTWRGEVDNPGSFELYLGEVDDLLSAVKFVKTLPYADGSRIYFVGYSASGTIALHASERSNGLRALFSIGGGADFAHEMADGKGYEQVPFDIADRNEIAIRNPRAFVDFMQTPTYFFEGGNSWYAPDGCRMEITARALGKPFQAVIIPGAHHWNVLQPACEYIAQRLLTDTNAEVRFNFTAAEARHYLTSEPEQH